MKFVKAAFVCLFASLFETWTSLAVMDLVLKAAGELAVQLFLPLTLVVGAEGQALAVRDVLDPACGTQKPPASQGACLCIYIADPQWYGDICRQPR